MNGAGNTVDIEGSNTDVIAGNATFYDGSYSGIAVAGSNDTINLNASSGATVGVTGTSDTVNAAGDAVNLGGSTVVTVNGNGDSIGIFGSNNSVVASNATVYDGSSTGTGVAGSGDTINLNSNSGASVTVTGTSDTVNATGDTVYVGAGSEAQINGNGTNIDFLTANSGSLAGVEGSGDLVTGNSGSNEVGLVGLGTSATVTGTGVVGLNASDQSLTLTNSGAVAETGNGLTGDTIAGSGETIYVGANTTATLSGPDDAVKVTQSGDNLTVDGNDTIYLSGAVSGIFGGTWSDGTFSGVYSGGGLNTAAVDYNDGYKDDFTYDYNSSGDEIGYTSELYSPGGSQPVWTGDYSANNTLESSTSAYTDPDGTYGYGGDLGDDDFGDLDLASSPSLAGPPGTNLGVIVNADFAVGDTAAAEAAEAAGLQAYLAYQTAGSAPQATSMFEGPAWDSNVITWSVATTRGTASSPFSSYMTAGEASLVSQAFQAWGAASGLTFEEVPDSSLSDIRIGWGTFGTGSSGVIGYTSFQAQSGQIQPGVIVRLEDPSEDALVTDSNGNLGYAGTNAEFYQVLLQVMRSGLPTTPTRTR